MRTITFEQQKAQFNRNTPLGLILNTPKPDFSELKKQSKEFERWISKEHSKERELIFRERSRAR